MYKGLNIRQHIYIYIYFQFFGFNVFSFLLTNCRGTSLVARSGRICSNVASQSTVTVNNSVTVTLHEFLYT